MVCLGKSEAEQVIALGAGLVTGRIEQATASAARRLRLLAVGWDSTTHARWLGRKPPAKAAISATADTGDSKPAIEVITGSGVHSQTILQNRPTK